MRIAVIVAGLTLSLTAVTAASSATQPLAGTGITPSDLTTGVIMAAGSDAMVHHPHYHHYMHHPYYHHYMHHPHYHHYKHHYRSHTKAGHGKT